MGDGVLRGVVGGPWVRVGREVWVGKGVFVGTRVPGKLVASLVASTVGVGVKVEVRVRVCVVVRTMGVPLGVRLAVRVLLGERVIVGVISFGVISFVGEEVGEGVISPSAGSVAVDLLLGELLFS